MCGIAGIHRRTDKPVARINELADMLLLGIDHRGGDATGALAIYDSGKTYLSKMQERAPKFVLLREKITAKPRTVLLHTRWATQGSKSDMKNAHPVLTGRVAAIHNGIIGNDFELFSKHGMKREAAVDSIIIPAIVDKFGWANANKAISQLRGSAAIALVHADHPGELILARTQSSPMHILITDEAVVWASEKTAIEAAWMKVYGKAPEGDWLYLPDWTMMRVNGTLSKEPLTRPPFQAPKTWKPTATKKWSAPKHGKSSKSQKGKSQTGKSLPKVKGMELSLTQQLQATLDDLTDERLDEYGATFPPLNDDSNFDSPHLSPEPWMMEEVEELMKWADCSYEEAYETVFGVAPLETDTGDEIHAPLKGSLFGVEVEWDENDMMLVRSAPPGTP